ncbi:hypothetical protein [Octadecabacter ascidiaceicola]|uniref:Uncharacterized protein n=1 Tax=Octadecabacter ascidiaceicola TaxID=1655543 RepID=A0A238JNJ5_9RHOB|nr:hypothetical protein [Octadecabacter ascidiaceicola]SMX32240.1 hypothetical protein OCA8868_00679 [Octadecabacter ascidiaceicola]
MISTDVYTPAQSSNRNSSTMSFGTHRQMDVPASAIRAGASTMPPAWQTRGVPTKNGGFQHGEPAKSFAEIVSTPFHRALATKPRKIAAAGIICMAVITYVF